jgi:PAS domain S-box-containing protein
MVEGEPKPWLTTEMLAALRDFWGVYEVQFDAIQAALLPRLLAHPTVGPILSAMPPGSTLARNQAGRERMRQAIFDGAWLAYEQGLRDDGVLYAKLGVSFRDWVEMIGIITQESTPRLVEAFCAEPARLIGVLHAMRAMLDHVRSLIGETYIQTQMEAARNSAIVETSEDAMISKSIDGVITSWNQGAERVFGYSAAEVIGKPISLLCPPDRLEEEKMILDRLRRGESMSQFETVRRRKDGRDIDVSLTISPIRSLLGEVVDASEVARDVTEDRKTQRALAEANRLKTQLLANMSHELRTPLNSIIGFAEVLHDGRVGSIEPKQKEFLGDILTSSHHLLGLINNVLDFSKAEAGKMQIFPEPVDLARLVAEVASILQHPADARGIRIETDVATLGEVVADPVRFKQVLYNFLSNALKFSPAGGRVAVRVTAEGIGTFRLEVEDVGPGISADDQRRLFNEFVQLDSGPGKQHSGTGLGLALTKRLVEAQGGSVGVVSEPGKGSRFFAVLPRHST